MKVILIISSSEQSISPSSSSWAHQGAPLEVELPFLRFQTEFWRSGEIPPDTGIKWLLGPSDASDQVLMMCLMFLQWEQVAFALGFLARFGSEVGSLV
jgi:hypothetical protein